MKHFDLLGFDGALKLPRRGCNSFADKSTIRTYYLETSLFKEVLLLLPLSSRRSASSQIVVRVRAIRRQKEEQIKIERVLGVLL